MLLLWVVCAPRFFTKLPVVALLKSNGHIVVIYLDDLLIIGKIPDDCLQGLWEAFSLLVKLGFIINLKKSVLVPIKFIEYLGFVLNSVEMKGFLPDDYADNLIKLCCSSLSEESCSIHDISRIPGTMIAYTTVVRHGRLFTCMLEAQHILVLKLYNNDFEQKVMLSKASRSDIIWWCKSLRNDPVPVLLPKATHSLHLDATQEGWGASHNIKLSQVSTGVAGVLRNCHPRTISIFSKF